MNDFFTELDSDLFSIKKIEVSPPQYEVVRENYPSQRKTFSTEVPLSKISQKHETKPVHERKDISRENTSHLRLPSAPPEVLPRTIPQSFAVLPKEHNRTTPIIGKEEAGKNHVLNMRTQMMQA